MSDIIPTSTLKPGYLVHLATAIKGNVSYRRRDIVREMATDDGKRIAEWNTAKTVNDAREHEEAEKIRADASNAIRNICADSAHGLLCPRDQKAALDAMVRDSRVVIADFNARARITRIELRVLCGVIAADDLTAMREINAEVRELIDTMTDGLQNFDVVKIRAAASKAKALDSMLLPETAEKIQGAIDAVRDAARRIVKAGEEAGLEVDRQALAKLREARTAFLDLDEGAEIKAPAVDARAVDLTPDAPESAAEAAPATETAPEISLPAIGRPKAPQFALEF